MLLNEGIANIYAPSNTGEAGEMPKLAYSTLIYSSYYGSKTIGVSRFWTAHAHQANADLLIEIQRFSGVSTSHRVEIVPEVDTGLNGFYKIIQFQHLIDNNGLPVTDLTLERIEALDEP